VAARRIDQLLSRRLRGYKAKSDWSQALCPFHSDTTPSFFVNVHTGFFHCFGCGAKGSLQRLLDRLNVASVRAEDLVDGRPKPQRRDPNETNELPNYILAAYRKCPKQLLSAGFKKELLHDYDVGFDIDNHRITYPIRDLHGNLVAVSGRNLCGEPKYKVYDEEYSELFPGYRPRTKEHLWNLDRLDEKIIKGGVERLHIVEGYKACLWLVQHGYDAVANMGAGMSRKQVELISRYDVPLVLFMDNDEAGKKATLFNYLELSKKQLAKVAQYPSGAIQPDDLGHEQLKQTLEKPQEFRRWFRHVELSRQTLQSHRSFHQRS